MDELYFLPEDQVGSWPCYSYILELAAEDDEDPPKEAVLCETNELARTTKARKLTQPNDNSVKAEPAPVMRAE